MRVHLVPDDDDNDDDDDDYNNCDDDDEDDDDDNLVAREVTEARWSNRWTRQFWWKLSYYHCDFSDDHDFHRDISDDHNHCCDVSDDHAIEDC